MSAPPAITVVLPTFNRAKFLPTAFASIAAQTLRDWDLVVVDDGSTDDTAEVVARLSGGLPRRTQYVRQENQGPYGARNAGLDLAEGRFIAFFDSDDEWLPHHLEDCYQALASHPGVAWVYGASRIVDDSTGAVTSPNTFFVDGAPRAFRRLNCRVVDGLHVLDEPDLIGQILSGAGLYAGLQNSVIRREVFERLRFQAQPRNEAEDQLLVIRAIAEGFRIGYIDNVHHVYHVHEQNSSGSALQISSQKQAMIYRELIRGYEELPRTVQLSVEQRRALDRKLAREYFWHLGYATYWQSGRRAEAMAAFRQALRFDPFRFEYWKTYLLARLRMMATPASFK